MNRIKNNTKRVRKWTERSKGGIKNQCKGWKFRLWKYLIFFTSSPVCRNRCISVKHFKEISLSMKLCRLQWELLKWLTETRFHRLTDITASFNFSFVCLFLKSTWNEAYFTPTMRLICRLGTYLINQKQRKQTFQMKKKVKQVYRKLNAHNKMRNMN